MPGYPRLSQITDEATKALLKSALDQIQQLKNELAALSAVAVRNDAPLDAGGQRVRLVANPDTLTDAVNVRYLRIYVQAQLEAFKGIVGVNGRLDPDAAQTGIVKNGLIVEIEEGTVGATGTIDTTLAQIVTVQNGRVMSIV